MSKLTPALTRALTLALALPFAQAAMAQTTTTAPDTGSAAATAPASDAGKADAGKVDAGKAGDPALSMGKAVTGQMYVKSTEGDWTIRCEHTDNNQDPCELYQLMKDDKGTPLAAISLFPLKSQGQAVAGATVLTPLETLLTQGVTISIDGAPAKSYPFSWCSQVGCVARIGLTKEDLDAYKKGAKATISLVALGAQEAITLPMSLKGFTAAYDTVEKNNAALPDAPMPPAPGAAPAKKN